MSVGFFVYILVFSKKTQRKTQRCLQNGAKKKHAGSERANVLFLLCG